MEVPHITALTGELEITHDQFTKAHESYEAARSNFNIAVDQRETRRRERHNAITALEKFLKQLKREV